MSFVKSTARYAQNTASQANNRRSITRVTILCILGVATWYFFWNRQVSEIIIALNDVPPPGSVSKAIVAAKTRSEDVTWMQDLRPDWTPYIYSTSQPPERGFRLSLPSHRGREAIAYLTFIIDNYAALPSYTAFIHAGATQRHNDILGPYTAPILQNLRFDSVDRLGYLNLRCTLEPGCPIGVNPLEPTQTDIEGGDIRAYFADVYMELFDVPASAVPKHVGGVCCGQFVVSRERIRARPRNDYERMRRWALESTVTDSFGVGWTFEKVWQVVFGMGDTYCPSFEECKCDLLGWCGPIPETCRVDGRDALPEALRVR